MTVKHAVASHPNRAGVGINGPRSPLGVSSERVLGNTPQPANLSIHLVRGNYSLDQDFKTLRIAHVFLRGLVERAYQPNLASELVSVYRLADFAQVAPQLYFLFAFDEVPGHRDCAAEIGRAHV